MSGVRGNIKALDTLATRLRSLPRVMPAAVAADAAPAIESAARAHAPVKSGRLRDSISVSVVGGSIVVDFAAPYARYTRAVPSSMPPEWADALRQSVRAFDWRAA